MRICRHYNAHKHTHGYEERLDAHNRYEIDVQKIQFGNVGANYADLQRPPHRRKRYDFGEVRVAMLTLLTLATLSEERSCGVVIAKFSGQTVTWRSSPTVFADILISELASTRIRSGSHQALVGAQRCFWAYIA